jgi:Fur family ferric uptake transcriptional regulator
VLRHGRTCKRRPAWRYHRRAMAKSAAQTPWTEVAAESLASAGYRRGGARRAVVELLGREKCALSVIEIEDRLRDADRSVARASIYRVIDQLMRLGLVHRIEVGRGMARFEAAHAQPEHHHDHLVCDDCGDIIPFRDEELERAIRKAARRVDFAMADHEVLLHGHCDACRS